MRSRPTQRPSGGANLLAAQAAALLLILAARPGGSADLSNPHAFMADETACSRCHRNLPPQGSADDYVRDLEEVCNDCHTGKERVFHPMDIRPRILSEVPLPLDYNGRMDCTTCHDPHAEPYADIAYVRKDLLEWLKDKVLKTKQRTYFLRMANDRGQLCVCCHDPVELNKQLKDFEVPPKRDYRGSASCVACHEKEYRAWSLTCHARTLQDPKTNPQAVRAEFGQGVSFASQEIVRTVGLHWTQRFVVDRAGELMVPKDAWSLNTGGWNMKVQSRDQSWREQCAGCHFTGYNPYFDTRAEDGVGCESCHGPGGRHVDSGKAEDIVNPNRLDSVQKDSICASCHTHGHDRTGQFRYPVGYTPGDDLSIFFRGLIPSRDQPPETHTGDGTLEDRLRTFQFWVDRFMVPHAGSALCRNYRSAPATEEESGPSLGAYCLTCHAEAGHGAAHRSFPFVESNCYKCHRPMRDRMGWPSVHDHKFAYGPAKITLAPAVAE